MSPENFHMAPFAVMFAWYFALAMTVHRVWRRGMLDRDEKWPTIFGACVIWFFGNRFGEAIADIGEMAGWSRPLSVAALVFLIVLYCRDADAGKACGGDDA